MTCGVACHHVPALACALPAGHDGEHEHRANGAHTRWRYPEPDRWSGDTRPIADIIQEAGERVFADRGNTRMRDIHDEQQARHDATVASAEGAFARKYPGVAKWLPVDLDAVQRETNRVVERVHAARAALPGRPCGACGEAEGVRRVAAGEVDYRYRCAACLEPEALGLTLADVERLAHAAIAQSLRHALGPGDHDASGIRVVVDGMHGSVTPRAWSVHLESGELRRHMAIMPCILEEAALEALTEAAFELLAASAEGTFARMYPGVAKWLPVDLDAVQRETNRIVERVHAAQAARPGRPCGACGETEGVRRVAAGEVDYRYRCAGCREPEPLTIADVERIARLAVAKAPRDVLGPGDHDTSGVRVVVDINRRWRDVGGHIVWLEYGGHERRTLIAARETEWQASERLAEAAFELLAQVGACAVARGGR